MTDRGIWVLEKAADKLSSLLVSPFASSVDDLRIWRMDWRTKSDLEMLHLTMEDIRAFLRDADEWEMLSERKELRLRKLIEVVYDAEDVIDKCQYEMVLSRLQSPVLSLKDGNEVFDLVPVQEPNELCINHSIKQTLTSGNEASELGSSSITVSIPDMLAVRVQMITKKLKTIAREWLLLNLKTRDDFYMHTTSSVVDEPSIHGRRNEKKEIVQMLLSENANSTDSAVLVLVITGFGGVGKTTVAELVYNDPRVRQSFDLTAWVYVGIDFNVRDLTLDIYVSVKGRMYGGSDNFQQRLMEELKGKRLLLVLDDVWNVKEDLWRELLLSLNHARSVVVVVTTRIEEAARIMGTMPHYSLNPLHFDHCWSLFKKIVFGHQDLEKYANLLAIGEKIVRKCDGVPLAVKALGSALQFSRDVEQWLNVSNSELWETEVGKMDVSPALKLSYNQMPLHLKQCFLIFSLFPKGFVFERENMVKLWLALDFVEPKSSQPLEEIANNYIVDFVRRSFIMQNSYNTREKGFLMHDLMHDLAQFVAGEEFTRADAGKLKTTFGSNSGTHSRHLRILDLGCTGIEDLPDSIGNLKQLRYLNLTRTNISKLPESVSYLSNLETLELRDCSFQELPQGITNLVNLRHLNFFDKNTCMPRGIGWLTNLETLPVLNIKRGSWHCEISELKGLKNLRGELTITGLRNVTSASAAYEANLQTKENLQALTLDWSKGEPMKCDHYDQPRFEVTNSELEQVVDLATGNIDAVLENLQPNIRLKELNIINYFGHRFPKWFGGTSFAQLARITLNGCGENCEVLPTLGLLPSLKSLYVLWMHNVQFIGREFCSHNVETKGFRSLETLEFKYMPNWVRWFGVEDGEFCRLHALRIVCCNQLQSLPQLLSASLTKLLINNCRELSVLPFLPSLTRFTLSGELSESLIYNLTLPSLKFLKIACSQCITSLSLSGHKFPSIEVLVIKGCKYLETIVGISSMTSLKRLEIVRCRFVQIYSNEDIPPSLQHLTIVRCHWLREWHQLISIKYRDQLNRGLAVNNSLKALEGMREEDIDNVMVLEDTEGRYNVLSTNDIRIEKRPIIIEEEQVWLEAKRRKENTLELGESSRRNIVPMDDDQDRIIIHSDQLTRGSVAHNSPEALEETWEIWEEVSNDEMIVEERVENCDVMIKDMCGMCEEVSDDKMIVEEREEHCDIKLSTGDVLIKERSMVMEEEEQLWSEAERRRKGKCLEIDESTHKN